MPIEMEIAAAGALVVNFWMSGMPAAEAPGKELP